MDLSVIQTVEPVLLDFAGPVTGAIGWVETILLEFVEDLYNTIGWPGVVFLMAVESAGIPFPSELIMPLAGWMLIQDKGNSAWMVGLAGFYGALGNLIGSWVAYWISLKGGRPLLFKYGKYALITREEVDRAEAWFNRYGDWIVFFSRLLPVVRTFISIPAGIARMNLWKFSILTFAGSFPWSLGLAYGGYLLGENWEDLRSVMRPFDIPILIILAAAVVWFLVRRIRAIRVQGNPGPSSSSEGTPEP
jgi:membrane protein DedA with SNARE-associated domain